MEVSTIIAVTTIFVTFICGLIAKKVSWFNNKLIPIQNLIIGILAGGVYYYITKDFNLVITTIGLTTGGTYDIASNIQKLLESEEK